MSHDNLAAPCSSLRAKGDIPHARLNKKDASDFSLAIARNDAKRFEDILCRIKGIDSSAFGLVLASQGPSLNMIEERSASPGLLARALSRAPVEVFDWVARSLLAVESKPSSWVAVEGIRRSGAFRDPRFIAKLLDGLGRLGAPLNIGAIAILAKEERPRQQPNSHSQNARWASQASEARNLIVEHFIASNPLALVDEVQGLNRAGPLDNFPLLQEAVCLAEKRDISTDAGSPPKRPRAPSL